MTKNKYQFQTMGQYLTLTAKTLNGYSYNLKLPPNTTVAQLATQVQVASGDKFHASNLRLVYAGQDLSTPQKVNKTLQQLGVQNRAILFIVLPIHCCCGRQMRTIIVKSLNGHQFKIRLPSIATLAQLANEVQKRSFKQYPADSIRFIYAGQELTNKMDESLEKLGIEDMGTGFVVLRVIGGALCTL